jgi:hypothetical protein
MPLGNNGSAGGSATPPTDSELLDIESRTFNADTTFAAAERKAFQVICTSGSCTITVGTSGTGAIPLNSGGIWELDQVPTGEIAITTTGTFIVTSNIFTTV